MYLKTKTNAFIKPISNIEKLHALLQEADAILIGAGAGLSTAAGLRYDGERFRRYFQDFIDAYHFTNMYEAGFYPFATLEEYWGYWSRHIYHNRYAAQVNTVYADLLSLVKDKDYFVITTNVDHQFQLHGFAKERLFYTQGDYGLFQCSRNCHAKTYDNEKVIRQMVMQQKKRCIPKELIPYCPYCPAPMTVNLRCDANFCEDAGWHAAQKRYQQFLKQHKDDHIVYLELGVGNNTPGIIKYPFWQFVHENPQAYYVIINQLEAYCPMQLAKQSLVIEKDIASVLKEIKAYVQT